MAAKPLPSPPMGTSAKPGGHQPRRLDIRVLRVPVQCFRTCFWKRFPRSPRYPRSGAFWSVIRVLRVLLAYGDNVLAGMVSGSPKMALL